MWTESQAFKRKKPLSNAKGVKISSRGSGGLSARISPWGWGKGSPQRGTSHLRPRKIVLGPVQVRQVVVPGEAGIPFT